MKKYFLIAASAAALAIPSLTSIVLAAPPEQTSEHRQFSPEDRAAFTDARIAALKAGLKLSPAQEKYWPALETTLRDVAKARAQRAAEWREKAREPNEQRNAVESLQERAQRLTTRAGELQKIADAAKPLFGNLDEAQQRRFGVLLHAFSGGHHGHWGEHYGWRQENHEAGRNG